MFSSTSISMTSSTDLLFLLLVLSGEIQSLILHVIVSSCVCVCVCVCVCGYVCVYLIFSSSTCFVAPTPASFSCRHSLFLPFFYLPSLFFHSPLSSLPFSLPYWFLFVSSLPFPILLLPSLPIPTSFLPAT